MDTVDYSNEGFTILIQKDDTIGYASVHSAIVGVVTNKLLLKGFAWNVGENTNIGKVITKQGELFG